MAQDLNVFICIGRLTRDAELKTFGPGGKKFIEFSIANNTGYDQYAKVQFFDCIMIGEKRAEAIHKYLSKGTQVAVTGEMQSNDYTVKDGTKRYGFKLQVDNVQLLGSKKENSGGHQELDEQDAVPYMTEEEAELDKKLKSQANAAYRNTKGGTF